MGDRWPMQTINLTSHFLIAMPAMSDPNFSRTLTFVCEHNERGALGIVVNRPIDVTLAALFRQVEIPLEDSPLSEQRVFFGGPVQFDHGFVLHRPVGAWKSTLPVATSASRRRATSWRRWPRAAVRTSSWWRWATPDGLRASSRTRFAATAGSR